MPNNNALVVDRLVKTATFGAFCGMAAAGWILWFDVSSIGTLLSSSQNALLANLFLGSGMLKGALLGGTIGLVTLGGISRARRTPVMTLPAARSSAR
jgi:hypothetical protein